MKKHLFRKSFLVAIMCLFFNLITAQVIAPTSSEKLEVFPEFSWDRIPRASIMRKSRVYTDEEIERVANMSQIVMLEKANSAGLGSSFAGMRDADTRLKEYNPNIKTFFYWNHELYYGDYGIDPLTDEQIDEFVDNRPLIRNRINQYDRGNANFFEWWQGTVHKMLGLESGFAANGAPFQPSTIDGTFIDRIDYPAYMYIPLYESIPDTKLVMCNNSNDRARLNYIDGSYREAWWSNNTQEEHAEEIAFAQEHAAMNKFSMWKNDADRNTSEREMEDDVDYRLAYYLIYAGDYAYFYHQQSVDATHDPAFWLTDYYDQFQRPLGEPTGVATPVDYVYNRNYEHCDVYLDIKDSSYNPETVSHIHRILWKNDVGEPNIVGSGNSNADGTYNIKGGGIISRRQDNFFFMSDLHYGDGELKANVNSLTNTSALAKAGVMFRYRNEPEDRNDYVDYYERGIVITPRAPMVCVVRNPAGEMEMLYRENGNDLIVSAGTAVAANGPYARIVREGDTFTGYSSSNGTDWIEIGVVDIDMGERVEMGMAVTSGNQTQLAEAVFSEFDRIEGEGTYNNTAIRTTTTSTTSNIVQIIKRNATDFAIDGNHGGENEQDVYLWSENENNQNQQWIEIDRGNGYYSYQKIDTNYCIDGGRAGENGQNVYLWDCGVNNQNQHWQKVDAGGGAFKLIKRNAPGFALNGGNGGERGQTINLFDSSNSSQNLQWFITPINGVSAKSLDTIGEGKVIMYPNPVASIATIQGAANTTVRIYDMNGKIVFTKNVISESETLDLNTLAPGIYYAQISGLLNTNVVKVIKQ